jgi:diphosphomevalonate decarboxylase
MKRSAIAHPNLALVKYWGKRCDRINLPETGSIGINLESLTVHTTVELLSHTPHDSVVLNGERVSGNSQQMAEYFTPFLNRIRQQAGSSCRFRIISNGNFPPSAGLASSSAGFAALSFALNELLNLKLPRSELSGLARTGSGSAARSIPGGFVEWRAGCTDDGSDSFATTIYERDYWPELRVLVLLTERSQKAVSSRKAMQQSRESSPFYSTWKRSVQQDLKTVRKAIRKRNFRLLGETMESNAFQMHAVALSSIPSTFFWNDTTVKLIRCVQELRHSGDEAYCTIDAGPQVKVLCMEHTVEKLQARLKTIPGIVGTYFSQIGGAARETENHLF